MISLTWGLLISINLKTNHSDNCELMPSSKVCDERDCANGMMKVFYRTVAQENCSNCTMLR